MSLPALCDSINVKKNFEQEICVEMTASFSVGELIGRGQYGQVYRATYGGSKVAIKRVLIEDWEYGEMKKLDHPNVLKLLHLEDKDPFRLIYFLKLFIS
jgi:serine/threonine protein kinase